MVQNIYMAKRVLNALEKELHRFDQIQIKDSFSPDELKKLKSMVVKFEHLKKDIGGTLKRYNISSERDLSNLTPAKTMNLSKEIESVISYHTAEPKTFKDISGPLSTQAAGFYNIILHLSQLYDYITQRETREMTGEKVKEEVEKLRGYLKEEVGSTISYLNLTKKIFEKGVDTIPLVEKKSYEMFHEIDRREETEKKEYEEKYKFGRFIGELVQFLRCMKSLGFRQTKHEKDVYEKYKSEVPVYHGAVYGSFMYGEIFDNYFLKDIANLRKTMSNYRKLLTKKDRNKIAPVLAILLVFISLPFLFYRSNITGGTVLSSNYGLGLIIFIFVIIVYAIKKIINIKNKSNKTNY